MLTRTDSSSSHLASVLCVATHCKHSCFQVANKSLLLDTNLFSFTALHHGKKLVNVTGDTTFQIPLVSQLLYLKSLIADFFAFLVPDNLGLWISCGLAHKGRDSPLDACLVLWGSCESRGCCMKKKHKSNIRFTLSVLLCVDAHPHAAKQNDKLWHTVTILIEFPPLLFTGTPTNIL